MPYQKIIEMTAAFAGALSFSVLQPSETFRTTMLSVVVGVSFGAFVPPWIAELCDWRTDQSHVALAYAGGLLGMPASRALLKWTEGGVISILNGVVARITGTSTKGEDDGKSD